MIKKIKSLVVTLASMVALGVPVLMPATVAAQNNDIQRGLCGGANLQVEATNCADPQAEDRINSIITLVINIFSLVVGVISVIMIIIGGLKYITSGGESSNVTSAKNTILYAIVGLVIVALAQFIVRFVLSRVTEG